MADSGDQGSGTRRKAKGSDSKGGCGLASSSPCGACKFLRRKCISGCIFAPYFGSDHGSARFAAVHKVFGASNVSKLLSQIPVNYRHEGAVTISYEAQARLSDPVYGCMSTVIALQQEVASLQGELAMVKTRLMNSRVAHGRNGLPNIHQRQPNINLALQPAYFNNSSASTNLMNMSCFNPAFYLGTEIVPSSSQNLETLQLSRLSPGEEEDEEESRIPQVFNNEIEFNGQ